MDDLYEVLGVKKGASKDEIKRAYRKKAKAKHPDRDGGDAEAMKDANKAYAVLSDEEQRKQYDSTGKTGPRPPTIEERAVMSLAKAFDDMLSEEAPQGDIVGIIGKAMREAIMRYEVEAKKIEKYLTGLDKKAGYVTRKVSGGINLWENVIAERRKRYERALEQTREALEVTKKAQEILAEYAAIEVPENQPKQQAYQNPWENGTWTTTTW